MIRDTTRRHATAQRFHRETQAAEIVEGVVVIHQAVEIAGAPQISVAHLAQVTLQQFLLCLTGAVGGVRMTDAIDDRSAPAPCDRSSCRSAPPRD